MKLAIAASLYLTLLTNAVLAQGITPGTLLPESPGPNPTGFSPAPQAPKPISSGRYVDAAGNSHPWQISMAHTLEWNDSPYLPVGVQFVPASWQPNATDASWQQDQQALAALHARGIADVFLSAGPAQLVAVPAAHFQRVLDCLDSLGVRYGIEIGGYPKSPLTGFIVKPGAYRDPSPSLSGAASFSHIDGLIGGVYMLVSSTDEVVDESGQARTEDGSTALIDMVKPQPDDILLLYPQVVMSDHTPESHLPDLWDGFDDYRDSLLSYFHRIKLGPGFRFFLDPLSDGLAINGAVNNLIPTTDGFRLDFEAWLENHYQHNIDDLNRSWGIDVQEQILPDFSTAARCIPLWSETHGIPAVYDPVKAASYPVVNKPRLYSHYWDDLAAFRQDSVRGYMNDIAQALKLGVADVPVIYRWTQQSGIFTNDQATTGFDGLAISPGTGGSDVNSAAFAYAQCEDSARTMWLIVTDLPVGGSAADAAPADRDEMFGLWDSLREVGARGYFAQGSAAEGVSTPDSTLTAIAAYADSLAAMGPDIEDTSPSILWYPAGSGIDVGVRRLPDGIWWLPGYQPGAQLTLGSALEGYYTFDKNNLRQFVLWSRDGTTAKHEFTFGKTEHPVVTDAAGLPLRVQSKGPVWTITVGPDPVLISNVFTVPLPADAEAAAETQAKNLMALADYEKVDVDRERNQLFYTLENVKDTPDNQEVRFDSIELTIEELLDVLQPYIWLEGESASANDFNMDVADPQASNGAYLSLDTDSDPVAGDSFGPQGYYARYTFAVNTASRYTLWVAGSPANAPDYSPYTFTFDGDVPRDLSGAASAGATYDSRFVWTDLGDVELSVGMHNLTISVTDRDQTDNRFRLDLDTLCLIRVPFAPDGVKKPVISTWLPAALAAAQAAAKAAAKAGATDGM